ncbi:MAG: exo-alpha-sialidase [Acidobacteria bacterium]|nr:exo-alpha-sialidase [Acidobacteriota bacterium]
MRRIYLFLILLPFIALMISCEDDPVPKITSISPDTRVSHTPTFTLTVNGSDFMQNSRIVFNGQEMTTNYVSSSELTCTITPDDIPYIATTTNEDSFASGSDYTREVWVTTPDAGNSDTLMLNVLANHSFSTESKLSFENYVLYGNVEADSGGNLHFFFTLRWPFAIKKPTQSPLYYKKSTDGGLTWSVKTRLNTSTELTSINRVIMNDDVLDLFYINERVAGTRQMMHTQSVDNGASWSTPETFWSTSWYVINFQIMKSTGETYHGVLENRNTKNGNSELFYVYNNGSDWTKKVGITSSTHQLVPVGLSKNANTNELVIMYLNMDYANYKLWDLFKSTSSDSGSTWTKPVRMNLSSYATDSWVNDMPVFCTDGQGNVAMIFRKYKQSSLSLEAENNDEIPEIVADPISSLNIDKRVLNNLRKVNANENNKYYFKVSSDYGFAWTEPQELSSFGGTLWNPIHLKYDAAGNLNLVLYKWSAQSTVMDSYSTYFTRSTDNGSSWSNPVKIPSSSLGSYYCRLGILDSGKLFILWNQHQNASDESDWDYYYRYSNYF